MKEDIYNQINNTDFLYDVSFDSNVIYSKKKYEYIYNAKLNINENIVKLKICVPKYWKTELIDIYVENYIDLMYMPHIEYYGKLCLFQLEGVIIDCDLLGILSNCLDRAYKILFDGLNNNNFYDFIKEFDTYIIHMDNCKKGKMFSKEFKTFKNLKFGLEFKKKKIGRLMRDVDDNTIYISDDERDIKNISNRLTIYNGINIFIDANELIFPPDWRKNLNIEYINILLEKVTDGINDVKKYLSEKGLYKFILFNIEQPNGDIVFLGVELYDCIYNIDENKIIISKDSLLMPICIYRYRQENLCKRGGGESNLYSKKILVIGCGSIGGYVIDQISKSGINNIYVYDDDILTEENIYRHVLGNKYVGSYKSQAICEYIRENIPKINIVGTQTKIEYAIEDESLDLRKYDLILSTTGNHNTNRWLNEYMINNKIETTVMYIWNEVLDIGNHIAIINIKNKGCYECFFKYDKNDEIYDRTSYCKKGQNFVKSIMGCGSEFLPYSSVHSLRGVSYAIEYIKMILNGKVNDNLLISIKGNKEYLEKNGYHVSNRYTSQINDVKILRGDQFFNNECRFFK